MGKVINFPEQPERFIAATHQYIVEFRSYEDAALNKGWGKAVRFKDRGAAGHGTDEPWSQWSAHAYAKQMNEQSRAEVVRVLVRPVGDWTVDRPDAEKSD